MPTQGRPDLTAQSFLEAPCPLRIERRRRKARGLAAVVTWRDWLVDTLVTLVDDGEGFDRTSPNGDGGWWEALDGALEEHRATFKEAIAVAFRLDTDGRDRPVLAPSPSQEKGLGFLFGYLGTGAILLDAVSSSEAKGGAAAQNTRGLLEKVDFGTLDEHGAGERLKAALNSAPPLCVSPLAMLTGRWEADAAAKLPRPVIPLQDVVLLMAATARFLDRETGKETPKEDSAGQWRDALDYLRAVVIRRQPAIGMDGALRAALRCGDAGDGDTQAGPAPMAGHGQPKSVTGGAPGFLEAPCSLWLEDGRCPPGPAESLATWRDWLVDLLVTMHEAAWRFNAKRPNCDAGWDWHLPRVLARHGTTFAEVVVAAFCLERDERDRALLAPDHPQMDAMTLLIETLSGDRHASQEETAACGRLLEAVRSFASLDDTSYLVDKWRAEAASDVWRRSLPMSAIRVLRNFAARRFEEATQENLPESYEWRAAMDYLDRLVIRR